MSLLDRIRRRGSEKHPVEAPPERKPDPEIVESAIRTTRALTKADAALLRRQRLNLELRSVEQQLQARR